MQTMMTCTKQGSGVQTMSRRGEAVLGGCRGLKKERAGALLATAPGEFTGKGTGHGAVLGATPGTKGREGKEEETRR
jgi:hypothetical protein